MSRLRAKSVVTTAISGLAITMGMITPAAAEPPPSFPVPYANGQSGTCLDWAGGTTVGVWHCNYGADNQAWGAERTSPNTWRFRNQASGACLDWSVETTRVGSWHCNGGLNQDWYVVSNQDDHDAVTYELRNKASGTCLDWSEGANRVGVWHCNGGNNQLWYIPLTP